MLRARRWAARHHSAVWWITLVNLTFGLVFTILVPPFRGPDERYQVDMVLRSDLGYVDPSERVVPTDEIRGVASLAGPSVDPELRYRPPMPFADAVPRPDRPTFGELAQEVAVHTDAVPRATNQLSQHPPLHYAAVGASARVVTLLTPAEAWSWDREVWLYRMHSVALVAALPLLASSAALVLGAGRTAAASAAAVMLLSPMHTFIGSVVNNDTTMMLGSAIAVVGALAHLRDGTARSAVVAAAGGAIAALSKSTGVTLIPWVGVVVAVVALRAWRQGRRREAVRNVVLAGSVSVIGAAWHITNLVRFGDPQPSGLVRRVFPDVEKPLWRFAENWFDRVSGTFWGRPAPRTGVMLDPWITNGLTVVMALVVFAALWKGRRRAGVLLLTLLCVAQVALMLRTNLAQYLRSGELAALQGRYLYSLLVPLAALAAVAVWGWVGERWHAWVLAALAGVGVVFHVVLSWSMLVGYWGGDSVGSRLDSLLAWSPLPHLGSLLLLSTPLLAVAGWGASLAVPRWRRR